MSHNALATDTDTGMVMSEVDWLRIHHEACAVGYDEQLAFCQFETGSRLIDVGCGPGFFLPGLARRLGRGGEVVACDISQSHLDYAQQLYGNSIDGCTISYQLANAIDLPFADGSFDAYWSANVSQYFDDDQFRTMLAEARRITRRGGRVAFKDWDAALFRVEPAEAGTAQRLMNACNRAFLTGSTVPVTMNVHRATTYSHIRRWLTEAGLRDARQHSTLIEFGAPLSTTQRMWTERLLQMFATVARELNSPDQQFWAQFTSRPPEETIIGDPGFYCTEGSMVGLAFVP
jgi:ubiquinone/menaquinone biosynthesis C-methylase UbiE